MNFIEFETKQKLRGGYYTPNDLASFLVKWLLVNKPQSILEPSCGDGVFLRALAAQDPEISVCAVEIEPDEARKSEESARISGIQNLNLTNTDFLGWAIEKIDCGQTFDAVMGNPPFVRYQYLPAIFQERAEHIFKLLKCKFTKHTNAWVPFILASLRMLSPGGRLGMVVPSEIIHVMHAQSLRDYIAKEMRKVVVVDPEEIWFEDTLQGAVLLMIEKKHEVTDPFEGLSIQSVSGRSFLNEDPEKLFRRLVGVKGNAVKHKWTKALLGASGLSLIERIERMRSIHKFADIANVDVGIVTGANKFFLVNDETVEQYELHTWVHPMFGRSEHSPGVIYDVDQHQRNGVRGHPTNFLWLTADTDVSSPSLERYLRLGEAQDLHKRYKCRIRSPWYAVPSVFPTNIGMLKRSHDAPRLIWNRMNAFTTDTAYRIETDYCDPERLVATFLNPLTALSAELEGRHYGGGVLELVPSEIERLLVPDPAFSKAEIDELNADVRSMSMASVLEKQSAKTLSGVGLSKEEQDEILHCWSSMKNRRQRNPAEVEAPEE